MSKVERMQERQDWTRLQHNVAGEKYTASRSTVLKQKSKGVMMTLRRMAVKVGNDRGAALNYALACLENGEFELCVP